MKRPWTATCSYRRSERDRDQEPCQEELGCRSDGTAVLASELADRVSVGHHTDGGRDEEVVAGIEVAVGAEIGTEIGVETETGTEAGNRRAR